MVQEGWVLGAFWRRISFLIPPCPHYGGGRYVRTIAAGQRFAVLRAAAEDMKSLLVILWPAGLQIRLQDILVTILGRIV